MAVFFTILFTIWLIILAVVAKVNKRSYQQRLGALVLMAIIVIPFAISVAALIGSL